MATKPETTNDIKVDPNSLYLEEIFTDRRIGTIRRLTPVKKDGKRDEARAILYVGETQMMTPADALPRRFEIGDRSLEPSGDKHRHVAPDALQHPVRELPEII